jgi:hypothetical protein
MLLNVREQRVKAALVKVLEAVELQLRKLAAEFFKCRLVALLTTGLHRLFGCAGATAALLPVQLLLPPSSLLRRRQLRADFLWGAEHRRRLLGERRNRPRLNRRQGGRGLH